MKILSLLFLVSAMLVYSQTKFNNINTEIKNGNFSMAASLINEKLQTGVDSETKSNLEYQLDLMNRIKLDFKRDRDYVKQALAKYYPDLTDKMLDDWEKNKSLEVMVIDGEKRYFNNAVPNLFRVNKEAKKVKDKVDGPESKELHSFLKTYFEGGIDKDKIIQKPLRIRLTHTVTLKPNTIPEGEVVRCWLPYPKENHARQQEVKFISTSEKDYVLSDKESIQRSIYMEKPTVKDQPTEFKVSYEYTSYMQYHNLANKKLKPYNKQSEIYKKYTAEEENHIIFTKEVKDLAKKIIGNEKDPYKKVVKLISWMTENIPWASAREYSTLNNIPAYCIDKGYGDCGIKSLFFITLARYSGVPAKWQSGWMLHPGSLNLHDWAEVYFEEIGWVTIDPDFGIMPFGDESVKYFFTNGTDNYHFAVNDDIAAPFIPAKKYPRSEPWDFQRGELEWSGGNLYFNNWNYHMDVEFIKD